MSLAIPTANAGFTIGIDTFQPDHTFTDTVRANGTTYGTQTYDKTSEPIGIMAGYTKRLGRYDALIGFSSRTLHYRTSKGTQATADTATNDATIATEQAVIDAQEALASPDQTVIDTATTARDAARTLNANINNAHKRSENPKSLVLGATTLLYGSRHAWHLFGGGRVYVAIRGDDYADSTFALAELGVRRDQFSASLIGSDQGAFLTASLAF